jgi:hypothetical protein
MKCSDFFDIAAPYREQSHLARQHARYVSEERSYDLAILVLTLAGVVAMIWGMWQ